MSGVSADGTPTQARTPWMVHAFVMFALLQAGMWVRMLTLDRPPSYDGTNGGEWNAYAGSMHDTAFLAGAGGTLVVIALAITSIARRATRTVERVLWLLVAPAMTAPGWMVWYPIALSV
ncbi:MAG: hypothetical protein IPJ77_12805 [Planctomycetes bacterium]|nr:hypothetical protein [Planctomycetota bacterium]